MVLKVQQPILYLSITLALNLTQVVVSNRWTKDKQHISISNHDKRDVKYRHWTNEDREAFGNSRVADVAAFESRHLEAEDKDAQNTSICNYTVVPIPEPKVGRTPAKLDHVRCNNKGLRCHATGTYHCLQTYQNIQVLYGDGVRETLKLYAGCICGLLNYTQLEPFNPDLPIND